MKVYLRTLFALLIISSGCSAPQKSAESLDEAISIVERACYNGEHKLFFQYTDVSGLKASKVKELKKSFSSLPINLLDKKGYSIKVMNFEDFDPYPGWPEKMIKRMEIRPRIWNIKPQKIIQFVKKSENDDYLSRYNFGVFEKNGEWRFSVAYQKDLLPKSGTTEFPVSDRKIKNKRHKIKGYNFMDSFGSHTPPFRYTHEEVIEPNSSERSVILKEAAGEYKVDLSYLGNKRSILIVYYEDQFQQSRIEVFQSE